MSEVVFCTKLPSKIPNHSQLCLLFWTTLRGHLSSIWATIIALRTGLKPSFSKEIPRHEHPECLLSPKTSLFQLPRAEKPLPLPSNLRFFHSNLNFRLLKPHLSCQPRRWSRSRHPAHHPELPRGPKKKKLQNLRLIASKIQPLLPLGRNSLQEVLLVGSCIQESGKESPGAFVTQLWLFHKNSPPWHPLVLSDFTTTYFWLFSHQIPLQPLPSYTRHAPSSRADAELKNQCYFEGEKRV